MIKFLIFESRHSGSLDSLKYCGPIQVEDGHQSTFKILDGRKVEKQIQFLNQAWYRGVLVTKATMTNRNHEKNFGQHLMEGQKYQ